MCRSRAARRQRDISCREASKHNDGIAKYNNDKYNQYTLRSRLNFNVNKYIDFEENLAYFGSSYNYQGDGSMENTLAYSGENAFPLFPLTNPDGSYIYENPYTSYKPANGRAIMMMQDAPRRDPQKQLHHDITHQYQAYQTAYVLCRLHIQILPEQKQLALKTPFNTVSIPMRK